MKIAKTLLLSSIALLMLGGVAMGIPLHKIVLKSTVFIKNQYGNVGTGFLMTKKLDGKKRGTFLITNKHVLRKDTSGPYSKFIEVRFYAKSKSDSDQKIKWIRVPILAANNKFHEIVFMHPNKSVDIAGMLISALVNQYSNDIDFTSLSENNILTREVAQQELIDAGEDLLILGYPAGIFSETNYLPLVKSGLLSSSSSEDLYLKLGDSSEIKGKVYLVDGALFGGNSGGPVFIKPRWKAEKKKDGHGQTVKLGEGLPLYLLGVNSSSIQLSEKVYTRIFESKDISVTTQNKTARKKVEKDKTGEYIEIEKQIMLNVVFSSEYVSDIFNNYVEWHKARVSEKQNKEIEEKVESK